MHTFGTATMVQGLVQVGSVAGTLVPENADRRYLMMQNKDPAGTLYLYCGTALATTANGIYINPGSHFEVTMGAGNVYCGPITGIAAGQGAGSIAVVTLEGTARVL
jgi:hypothetical protein